MTLDEAILHAEEVAWQQEVDAVAYENCANNKENTSEYAIAKLAERKCNKCAEEHRQLAEWLKQLRTYKLAFGMNEKKVTGIVCCEGKVYKAFENDPILKAIDKNGFHTFYGFVEVEE